MEHKDDNERLVVLETLYKVLSDRQAEDRVSTSQLSTKMDSIVNKIETLSNRVYMAVGALTVIQTIVLGAVAVALRGAL